MDELWIVFGIIVILIVVVAGGTIGLGILFQAINMTYFDNVPSEIYVDGQLVYKGSSIGFDVESAGDNTTVTINGGFMYFFPQAYYTAKDVRVIGNKENR